MGVAACCFVRMAHARYGGAFQELLTSLGTHITSKRTSAAARQLVQGTDSEDIWAGVAIAFEFERPSHGTFELEQRRFQAQGNDAGREQGRVEEGRGVADKDDRTRAIAPPTAQGDIA